MNIDHYKKPYIFFDLCYGFDDYYRNMILDSSVDISGIRCRMERVGKLDAYKFVVDYFGLDDSVCMSVKCVERKDLEVFSGRLLSAKDRVECNVSVIGACETTIKVVDSVVEKMCYMDVVVVSLVR